MRYFAIILLFSVCCIGSNLPGQDKSESMTLVDVQKIWDKAPHNAFTDLVRFRNRWFCAFREGSAHVSPDGALRIITSTDGKSWNSAALFTSPKSDLRDAKLTITADGQLMLSGAEALHDRSSYSHQSLAWFSNDGLSWSRRYEIADPNFWLWRITWHKGTAYGMGYSCSDDKNIRLYSSQDGKHYKTIVNRLAVDGYPNESAIVFKGDTAYCLLRRDDKLNTGFIGIAEPPFTNWEWRDLGVRIGGPEMLLLPDGRFVAAVRLYDGGTRTSICWIDPRNGELTECLKLPSGGDTSYAGLVLFDDLLWASYYSSHEGQAAIYLAKIKMCQDSR